MNATTASRVSDQGETKPCRGLGPAVEVTDVGVVDIREEAERDAQRLLKFKATTGFAVEPVSIANRLGVEVLEADLDEEKLGGLLIEPGEDPKILLNGRHGFIRRRLTCAHEFGYYVRQSARTSQYARVDRRTDSSIPVTDPEDAYAEEFGACLLMPKWVVQAFAEIGLDDLEMAIRLYVSREAIQLRLKRLAIVPSTCGRRDGP
jgi:Zn-dependent peptidase ImmA (M78 family)